MKIRETMTTFMYLKFYIVGDINIKIPDTSTSIDLEGNSVTCDEKLNIIEKKTESIKNKQKLSGLCILCACFRNVLVCLTLTRWKLTEWLWYTVMQIS